MNMPELESYPDDPEGGFLGDHSIRVMAQGCGVITSQDADDLHEIHVQIALGPTPQHGVVAARMDVEGARSIANHLLHLANYAELGVEAPAP